MFVDVEERKKKKRNGQNYVILRHIINNCNPILLLVASHQCILSITSRATVFD